MKSGLTAEYLDALLSTKRACALTVIHWRYGLVRQLWLDMNPCRLKRQPIIAKMNRSLLWTFSSRFYKWLHVPNVRFSKEAITCVFVLLTSFWHYFKQNNCIKKKKSQNMFLVSQTEGSEVFTLSLGYCTTFLHKRELRRSGSSGSWGSDETAIVPGPRPEIFHQPFSLFVKRLIIQITFNLISVKLSHCGHIRWGERWRGEAVPCRFQNDRNIYQHG